MMVRSVLPVLRRFERLVALLAAPTPISCVDDLLAAPVGAAARVSDVFAPDVHNGSTGGKKLLVIGAYLALSDIVQAANLVSLEVNRTARTAATTRAAVSLEAGAAAERIVPTSQSVGL